MDRNKILGALFDIQSHCQYLESCVNVKDWTDMYISSLVDERIPEIEKIIGKIKKLAKC